VEEAVAVIESFPPSHVGSRPMDDSRWQSRIKLGTFGANSRRAHCDAGPDASVFFRDESLSRLHLSLMGSLDLEPWSKRRGTGGGAAVEWGSH
jgi:hypothetical protein